MNELNLNDGFIAQMLEQEAWKEISESHALTLDQLELYKDKLDWEEVSGNCNIAWTVQILEKFKKRINWRELSSRADRYLLSVEMLEQFKEYWDWNELSRNSDLPLAAIEKFADLLDWKELIDRYHDDMYNEEFVKKYQQYIPAAHFKGSCLWRKLVEDKAARLRQQLSLVK